VDAGACDRTGHDIHMSDVYFRLAANLHQQVEPVAAVMRKANELMVPVRRIAERKRVVGESFERATAWVMSLAVLNRPVDIQAIHAATRSLFEIAVDMVILHNDTSDKSAELLTLWEDSQRLKAAEEYVRYLKRAKGRIPAPAYVRLADFAQSAAPKIEAHRREKWNGRSTHRERWRSDGSLLDDVFVADANRCECWKQKDSSFEEVYAERMNTLNWLTHGSGNTALRGQDGTDPHNVAALRDALWSAELCLKIAAHEFPAVFSDGAVVTLLMQVTQRIAMLNREGSNGDADEDDKPKEV